MWQDMFDLQVSAGEKVLRAILIYLFLIAILRIVGKRELGQANTLDLVVLLLVANAVQNGTRKRRLRHRRCHRGRHAVCDQRAREPDGVCVPVGVASGGG